MNHQKFTKFLKFWHNNNNTRQMPWKGEKDPYKIWLSEIILQQTRVEQGWAYYEKFVSHYPDIAKLANAKDEDVFKLWEGLGYYNRCKNLLFTARFINKENKAVFPHRYEDILALKGIGPYTAAAISSFAFNGPYAVVDGNVFRVLSRIFGISTAIDSTAGKKLFTELAQKVLDKNEPGSFNQAIMDFGATVCKPATPLCATCPLQKICVAYTEGIVNQLPVKEKLLQKKTRWFTYFLFQVKEQVLVHKRISKDIWENLHEFYLLETDDKPEWNNNTVQQWLGDLFNTHYNGEPLISPVITQQLTHQHIKARFIKVLLPAIPANLKKYSWLPQQDINRLAFPKIINQYLQMQSFQASLF